jgi:SNF2 family DNA or RNA helicase
MASKNQDNKTYLVVDKYVSSIDKSILASRSYNNNLTKNITVEGLFSSNNKYVEGNEAIRLYNEHNVQQKIPVTITKHKGLYTPYYFIFENGKLEYRIMLVAVDNNILFDICAKNKQSVPEMEFLSSACNDNKLYVGGGVNSADIDKNIEKELIDKNMAEIVKKATVPNTDPTDPIEPQPDFAKIRMYDYQKKTIKWMLSRELDKKKICINKNEVPFGDIVYNITSKKFLDVDDRTCVEFFGGALIDEVGLGKTYQMIATSLLNRSKIDSYTPKGCNDVCSKATLIICPNQLVGQWSREIVNVIKNEANIKIIPFFSKIYFDKYTYKDLLEADFVITSFNFLSNDCFLNSFPLKKSDIKSKTCFKTPVFTQNIVQKFLDEMSINLKDNLDDKLYEAEAYILLFKWHRIIIDEFHELYCVDKYKAAENVIRYFKADHKWCLTGTPFDKSDTSLCGMFNFVTNYKYESSYNDIWKNSDIVNHMNKYFFRRNTKQSVIEENRLLPLIEKIVWLNFSNTERMMYNAYMANPNVDKFNVTLRQLCCHPQIADEIKTAISSCKSLDEIQKTMIKVYEEAMNTSFIRTKVIKYRLECEYRKLEIAEWKQYARVLRNKGYSVKYELKDKNNDKYEKEMKELIKSLKDEDIDNIPKLYNYDELKDDDDDDEKKNTNKKKKCIIASNDTKDEIINMVEKDIEKKTMERQNCEENINELLKRKDTIIKDYNGKKNTYEYFVNVMEKLKKASIVENGSDSDSDSEEKEKCGVCLDNVTGNDLGVTICGHIFCYNCVKPFVESKNKCPMCMKPMNKSDLYMIIKNKESSESQQDFKEKQALIGLVGTKLANLIFFIKKNDKHCIIFSQWDDLLIRVGNVLNDYGIGNVFCKGNVWQRDKTIRDFNSDDKIKVIMLSSESAASGTNLTKAEMVILLDPVYGTYEYRRNTEWQAIGRAYRTGQTKQVQVVRFIVKNTVEEEIYDMNKKADIAEKKAEKTIEVSADNIKLEEAEIKLLIDNSKKKKPLL